MTLQDKIKIALEQGKVEGAKRLASELLKQEHKADWLEEKQAEYNNLFPTYTLVEKVFSTQDEADEFINNKDFFNTPRYDYTTLKLEYNEPIDYSEDENYISFNEWLNETRVVSEAVEPIFDTDDEGFDYIEVEGKPEVTELVRPYAPLDITDEMAEAKLNEFRDVKQETLDYLASTDWYVVRYAEKGIKVPSDIINNRQLAREKLN